MKKILRLRLRSVVIISLSIVFSILFVKVGIFLLEFRQYFFYTTDSVTIIESYRSPGNKKSIKIPKILGGHTLTTIEHNAFAYSSLESVFIPKTITTIGDNAFTMCSELTDITVDMDNASYASINGVLFNKAKTILIQYPGGKRGGYTIPSTVTTIEKDAFSYCEGLTSVEIPNGVTQMGDHAFAGCEGLTSVKLPNGLTNISVSLFHACYELKSAVIPNSVTSIGDYAFYGCPIGIIELPSSIASIGKEIFSLDALYTTEDTIILCYRDSYAQSYAINNNIPFELLD